MLHGNEAHVMFSPKEQLTSACVPSPPNEPQPRGKGEMLSREPQIGPQRPRGDSRCMLAPTLQIYFGGKKDRSLELTHTQVWNSNSHLP